MSDLLVRGGQVVDGTGAAPRRADVRILNGVVDEVGPDLSPGDAPVLDATGAFVTPGFIDPHTHFDPAVFWDPSCDPMPLHGITTMVVGNCSLSLAPLPADQRDALIGAFTFIEDLPRAAFEQGVPWTWESWSEYRAAHDVLGTAVNVAGLVGHSVLRLAVMGDDAWLREATSEERARLTSLFRECLEAGAYGLSTSFADVDANGRPVPSRRADDEELRALVEVMDARGRGMLEFVPLIDTQEGRMAGVERVHSVCRGTGVLASWTGFFPGHPDNTREIVEQARRTQREGPGVWPQISPRPPDTHVCLDQTISFTFVPAWHKLVQADPAEKRRMLADDWWRGKAREHWDRRSSPFFPTRPNRYPNVRLTVGSDAAGPECGFDEWIAEHGGHPSDALADWLLEHDLDVSIRTLAVYDPELVGGLMADASVLVGSSDAGAHCQMFCGAGDATLLLERHVRDRGDITLAEGVRRLTSEVADHFGIRDRGRVAKGQAGDLAIVDLAAVHWGEERLVDDLPGGGRRFTRGAAGYGATIVGGVATQRDGDPTGASPGGLLDGAH